MYWIIRSLNLHLTCQVQTLGPALLKCVDMQLPHRGKRMGPELAAHPPPQGIIPTLPSTGDCGLNTRGADTRKHLSMGQRPYFFPSTHVT